MAEVTKGAVPSPATPAPPDNCRVAGLYAGETIVQGDACYIRASDGRIMKASGAAANEAARFAGLAAGPATAGEPLTLHYSMEYGYKPLVGGNAVAAGTPLFLSSTVAGGLADAATTGSPRPVAVVHDTDGRIRVFEPLSNL